MRCFGFTNTPNGIDAAWSEATSATFPCRTASLPASLYRSNRFDGVLSISVIQHLPSKFKQLEAIQSLVRVCRPGGRVLIYVWSFEREDRRPRFPSSSSQDHFMTWELPSAPSGVTRYFYLFQHGELEWLCSYVPSVRILRRSFDGKNWCVELQKLSFFLS